MSDGSPLAPGAIVGIIGGGQLARMLAMAAARLGLQTIVLDPAAACPASQVCNGHIVADYDNLTALDELAQRCDVVTYEFENVPVGGVERLQGRVPIHPGARPLEVAQDRLVEKEFLTATGLTTAPYAVVDAQDDIASALDTVGGTGILKTRRLGYDGKGQLRVVAGSVPADAFVQLGSVPLIVEGLIDFDCEISVIAGRGIDGSVAVFEPSRNEHRAGILATSTVPSGVSASVIAEAKRLGGLLLENLDYVGVLGLELFVLSDGSLLANEFAPRVHNSGHWTEAACSPSQFEVHVRAVTGHHLVDPIRHVDAVMTNLIGDEVDDLSSFVADSRAAIHLYGKSETRPGRKMGHVTVVTPR